MEILRIPPYPLSITYTVPDDEVNYVLTIRDKARDIIQTQEVIESSTSSTISYTLPELYSKYDESHALTICEQSTESGADETDCGDIVVEDTLTIERPYVDPSTLGTTATEIAEYTAHEKLARAIIDSVTGGFYYNTTWIETVGQGTDYLPLWEKPYKILQVYENHELVYDVDDADGPALDGWNYIITKDKTAIIKDPTQTINAFNRSERKRARIGVAASDSISMFDTEDSGNYVAFQPGVTFPEGIDYLIKLERGWKVVPNDIQDATNYLIDDIKCGKLDYFKRYISNYSTDQFKIQYDKGYFDGTGNILVDKILDKYINNITRPGVL